MSVVNIPGILLLGLILIPCAQAERPYETEFRLAAEDVNIDVQLLRSLCFVESTFKARAIKHKDGKSGKTSYGICQLQLATARDMGFNGKIAELRKPEVNIKYAAEYLAFQLERYDNDVGKALTAYNRGRFRKGADRRNLYVAAVLLAYYEKR